MNSTTTITAGQSLLDVAVQELGTVAALFELADANGLALTDALEPGAVLAVPQQGAAALPDIAGYFAARRQRLNAGSPFTPVTPRPLPPDFDGFDFDHDDFYAY